MISEPDLTFFFLCCAALVTVLAALSLIRAVLSWLIGQPGPAAAIIPEIHQTRAPLPRIRVDVILHDRDFTAGNLRRALQYADDSMADLKLEPGGFEFFAVMFLGQLFATIEVRRL